MKGFYYLLGLATLLSVTSCDDTARLAKELPGTWAGTPENFTDNSAITATIIENYTIVSNPDTQQKSLRGGDILITGMISSTTQVVSNGSLIEPITLTAAAKSSIEGTWNVIDDDEVAVMLKPETLKVEVDPEAIMVNTNVLSGADSPDIDSLRPQVCANLSQGLSQALVIRYASVKRLDDVKIKGPILKFEIGKTDYVLTRQGDSN